jgi:hypothetical protein
MISKVENKNVQQTTSNIYRSLILVIHHSCNCNVPERTEQQQGVGPQEGMNQDRHSKGKKRMATLTRIAQMQT